MTVYEYRTFRIQRSTWPRLADALSGAVDERTTAAGGSLFAAFAGLIGLASDEGVLVRAWSDVDALARHAEITLSPGGVIEESRYEILEPTVRPLDATPPRMEGVYAHRWFWLQPHDWLEFERLSQDGIWPYFESDGCGIVGLWRSNHTTTLTKALLITRYPSVAHWERTRLQAAEVPRGADEALYRRAQEAGRRRARLTERSIVRLTRLVLPA